MKLGYLSRNSDAFLELLEMLDLERLANRMEDGWRLDIYVFEDNVEV